ncbi:MAG: nitrate/nitrite transporter [Thermoplasmata archaeon]
MMARVLFSAAAWVAIALLNGLLIAPAPVFPQLMQAYGIGSAAAGSLVSAILLTALLAQVPGAYLIDRLDNRKLVGVGIVGLSLASVPAFLVPTYEVALASRLVTGVFVPFIFVPLANLVSEAYPEARTRALGGYLSAPPAGYALGTFVTPLLPPVLGLFSIYLVYALPILLLGPVLLWSSRSLARDRGPMLPLRAYAAAFRSRELWRLGLAFVSTYALYILFTSWMPTFLTKVGGVTVVAGGALAALVPALGILARPLGGRWAETRFAGDKRFVLLVSFLPLIPLSLVWLSAFSLPWAFLLLPLIGFFIQLPFSVYYAFASQILPDRLRGSAYTFVNMISLLGGVLAPLLAGVLLDLTGSFAPSFLFAAALAGVGLLLTVTARVR